MNFLGKCFAVVLPLMSVAFMALAIAVYSTHRNLEAENAALSTKLREATQSRNALQDKYNNLETALTAETDAARQQIIQLESERARLAERNAQAQVSLDRLRAAQGEAVATANATQQNNLGLAEELKELRGSVRAALSDKDRYFGAALAATEELQAVRNDIETALEQRRDLVADTSRMASLLRANNLDPATPADAIKPRVDGFVSRTQRRDGVLFVEISIGSDDGLKAGHTVEVFRDTKYKGRVEILRTSPDRAVGRADVKYQQGPIQEGDRVATRLKLS